METRRLRLIVALAAVTLLALACAPPVAYRRTAIVPLPEGPARSGRPLDQGEVRFTGQVTQSFARPDSGLIAPRLEDPGLLIPQTVIGGSIYGGINETIEVGLGVAVGTQGSLAANFPNDVISFTTGPAVRISPGVRANIWVTDKLAISILTEMGAAVVHQALYRCANMDHLNENQPPGTPPGVGEPQEPSSGWCTTQEEFELVQRRRHGRFVGALMIEPVVAVNDVWSVFGHAGITQGITNIGFEPNRERARESTLHSYATVVAGLGGEARSGPIAVGLNFDFLVPLDDAIGVMPVVSVRVSPRIAGRSRPADPEAADL